MKRFATFAARGLVLALVLAPLARAQTPTQPQARAASPCIDEGQLPPAASLKTEPPPVVDPRLQLAAMVRDTLDRSQSLGAAKLIAEAARDDIDEARAAKGVQASIGGGVGPSAAQTAGVRETSIVQLRGNVNVSQLVYDGGRTDRLTDWRTSLADSARYGVLGQQEQLATSTVALALERYRYRQHVAVYGQYIRKMSCLAEALDTIVRSDRGRASELVLARKTLQQAELAQAQAQSQVRQVEVRLRKLVGDGLPTVEGLGSVLLQVPPLPELVTEAEMSADIAQLAAQANAADRYAESVAASTRPQVSWSFGGNTAMGAGGTVGPQRSGSFAVGLNINVPLLNPGVEPATRSARKRAAAAAMQRQDALEARRSRLAEVYEQTAAAFDRARRLGGVLRDSEQVRNFTLQQWQQLGKRSLFDVMGAESEHYNLRISYVNALIDGQQTNAVLLSLGRGVSEWLR